MAPTTLELTTPEEFRQLAEREFKGFRVTLRPSHQKDVFATLWVEVPGEQQKPEVQRRASHLCALFHDQTRKLILPIVVTQEEAAEELA